MSSSIKETGLCDFLVLGEFYYMALSFLFERVCLHSRVNIWSSVSEFTTRGTRWTHWQRNSARVGVKRRRPASDGCALGAHLGLISSPALVLQHEVGGRSRERRKKGAAPDQTHSACMQSCGRKWGSASWWVDLPLNKPLRDLPLFLLPLCPSLFLQYFFIILHYIPPSPSLCLSGSARCQLLMCLRGRDAAYG